MLSSPQIPQELSEPYLTTNSNLCSHGLFYSTSTPPPLTPTLPLLIDNPPDLQLTPSTISLPSPPRLGDGAGPVPEASTRLAEDFILTHLDPLRNSTHSTYPRSLKITVWNCRGWVYGILISGTVFELCCGQGV